MEQKKYKLSEIIDSFIPGDWGNENYSEATPEEIHCVRGADIVPIWNGEYAAIPIRFVSSSSLNTKRLKVGDIIIEKSGGSPTQSTGRTAFVSKELVEKTKNLLCTNFCTAFRIKSGWNPKYIYYKIQNYYNNNVFFNFEGKTSGLKNLQIESAFQAISIDFIPIEEQNAYVEVLDIIERKLNLNRAINRNLEAMAKRLYDYWFVQFDFPDENGRPYKTSGGKMVWNETLKRDIPEGWEVKKMRELLKSTENGEWGFDSLFNGSLIEIHCIRGADIVDLIGAPVRYISEKKTSKLLKEDDIIIEISGGSPVQATGRSNYVSSQILEFYNNKMTCSNFCKSIALKDKLYSPYFFCTWNLFYDNGNMFHYEGKTNGIKNLQLDMLLEESWYFPPKELAEKFRNYYHAILDKRGKTQKENVFITLLRDRLLPLLMNGQVSIKRLNSDLSAD